MDYEGAADFLRPFVKTEKTIDGILPGPPSKVFAMFEGENPAEEIQKVLAEVQTQLDREHNAALATRDYHAGDDAK